MDVVITTIFPPTKGTKALAEGLTGIDGTLWVIGDKKGPSRYDLPSAKFLSIAEQRKLPFQLAPLLPEGNYARKNLGYLSALQRRPDFLVETDDDNIPQENFWQKRHRSTSARTAIANGDWVNAYRGFTDGDIWPRGFPLEKIRSSNITIQPGLTVAESLIQQGLADGDPDVDAVYRMTRPLPFHFQTVSPLRLNKNSWCPFNSQNTTFFREASPLLYLPSYCSFRMTDIWRSFIAQRCLWEMDSTVLFAEASVYQERNEHDLRRDFEQEIPGYLQNFLLGQALGELQLTKGRDLETVCANLQVCYNALVSMDIIGSSETSLVKAWISDILSTLA